MGAFLGDTINPTAAVEGGPSDVNSCDRGSGPIEVKAWGGGNGWGPVPGYDTELPDFMQFNRGGRIFRGWDRGGDYGFYFGVHAARTGGMRSFGGGAGYGKWSSYAPRRAAFLFYVQDGPVISRRTRPNGRSRSRKKTDNRGAFAGARKDGERETVSHLRESKPRGVCSPGFRCQGISPGQARGLGTHTWEAEGPFSSTSSAPRRRRENSFAQI